VVVEEVRDVEDLAVDGDLRADADDVNEVSTPSSPVASIKDSSTHPDVVLGVVLGDLVERVLLLLGSLLSSASLGLLILLDSSRDLVRWLLGRRLALRLDVSGQTLRLTLLRLAGPVESEVDLLSRRVDRDGRRGRGEVVVDLAETGDGARAGRERLEEVRGGRVAGNTAEDDATAASMRETSVKTLSKQEDVTTHRRDEPPRRLAPWTPPAISPEANKPSIGFLFESRTIERGSISSPPMV
jgi:hypothetical protein